jgi:hypothetical protein
MTYPVEAYAAIDQLNSWVRSKEYWEWSFSGPKWAVYDWKIALIESALRDGIGNPSAIYLTLKCRDCGGTKQYTDSYGRTWPHCRKCSSKGVTRLEFLVTEVHGFKWHTPRDKTWNMRVILPEKFWDGISLSTDWEPNQAGKSLETWQVAECLNLLEPIMPKPGSHGLFDYGDWVGDSDHSKYKLFLGRSERVCQLCGRASEWNPEDKESKMDGVHHHVTRAHVSWSAWGCKPCQALYADCSIFERFTIPKIEHREILRWLERRAVPWLSRCNQPDLRAGAPENEGTGKVPGKE